MRVTSLAAGLLLLAALWLGPLPRLAQQVFSAHMTLHMGVVAVAAPLITFGLAGSGFDPVRKIPTIFAPIPASMAEFVVVWGWHAPALHEAARHSAVGFLAEQGTFLLSGLALWLSTFGGPPRLRPGRTAAGVIGILLTSMHMTLLGALLALAPRPLYQHAEALDGATPITGSDLVTESALIDALCRFPGVPLEGFGLSPLEDQQLGGAIMLLVGGTCYLAGGLRLTERLLRHHDSDRGGSP